MNRLFSILLAAALAPTRMQAFGGGGGAQVNCRYERFSTKLKYVCDKVVNPDSTEEEEEPELTFIGLPPLGERLAVCQGSCQTDWDCDWGLTCRDASQLQAPGCHGMNYRLMNYCYPPAAEDELVLTGHSGNLGACEGQCLSDDDCQAGLACFPRTADESIPGCTGKGAKFTNYCYDPTLLDIELDDVGGVPYDYLGEPPFNKPLQECEGDCDSDWNCAYGLNCYKRPDNRPVPGCSGDGIYTVDYCYVPAEGELVIVGDATTNDFPLNKAGACQGHCLTDADCQTGLHCMKRQAFEDVPGCTGVGAAKTNYCFDPAFGADEATEAPVSTSPTSEAPVVAPTDTPLAKPTSAPVVSPTETPIASPTVAPVVTPTVAPTASPTSDPVSSPTGMPTTNPTSAPVAKPTSAPVVSPTETPIASSTIAPVLTPTDTPTAIPTEAPVSSPTGKPSTDPTLSPIASPTETPFASPTSEPLVTPKETPAASPSSVPTTAVFEPIFINAGGGSISDSGGINWLADTYFNGGSKNSKCGATPNVYCSERFGNHAYEIPVPPGEYDIVLYFQEIYFNETGQRVFDVLVEGVMVYDDLDLVSLVGANALFTLPVTTKVMDGSLTIEFVGQTQHPKISGIVVLSHISTTPDETLSVIPSDVPTTAPSMAPTKLPSGTPTASPSEAPTEPPSKMPSSVPSPVPTRTPSEVPSRAPTALPSATPTASPSNKPSSAPSDVPTNTPTVAPSSMPTNGPSEIPSSVPSASPTNMEAIEVDDIAKGIPSNMPTGVPFEAPTDDEFDADAPGTEPTETPIADDNQCTEACDSILSTYHMFATVDDRCFDVCIWKPLLGIRKQFGWKCGKCENELEADEASTPGTPSLIPSALPTTMPSDIPSLTPRAWTEPPAGMIADGDVPPEIHSTLPSESPTDVPTETPFLLPSSSPSSMPSDFPSLTPLVWTEPPEGMIADEVPTDYFSQAPSSSPSSVLDREVDTCSEPCNLTGLTFYMKRTVSGNCVDVCIWKPLIKFQKELGWTCGSCIGDDFVPDDALSSPTNAPSSSSSKLFDTSSPPSSAPSGSPNEPLMPPKETPVASPTSVPSPVLEPIFINAGGDNDSYFIGGDTYSICGNNPDIYCSERWGDLIVYEIPVLPGEYNVVLYFQEIYFNETGQRIFDVLVEGVMVYDDLDLVSLVGANTSFTSSVKAKVADGSLTIEFVGQTQNAKISGIEISRNFSPNSSPSEAPSDVPSNSPSLAQPDQSDDEFEIDEAGCTKKCEGFIDSFRMTRTVGERCFDKCVWEPLIAFKKQLGWTCGSCEEEEHNGFEPDNALSGAPSDMPSLAPSDSPSGFPSDFPSLAPSSAPSASPSNVPSDAPSLVPSATPSVSPAPTSRCLFEPTYRQEAIEVQVKGVSSATDFADPNSAQSRALAWIVEEDRMEVCPSESNVIQRYVLALLYFETQGDDWFRCTQDVNKTLCDEGERFLSNVHECQWGFIGCDSSNQVTAIHLDDNNLVGRLPAELGSLAQLMEINMDSNQLSGTIPASLGQLDFLEILDLDTNQLEGSLPEELFDAQSLRVIDINSNALTGTISTRIGELSDLYFFQLDMNFFIGGLPPQMGGLPDLKYLSLYGSGVTEPIPGELCGSSQDLTLYADCDICTIDECCTACLMR